MMNKKLKKSKDALKMSIKLKTASESMSRRFNDRFCRTCLNSDIFLIEASLKILQEIDEILDRAHINNKEVSFSTKLCIQCHALFVNYFKFRRRIEDIHRVYRRFLDGLVGEKDVIEKSSPILSKSEILLVEAVDNGLVTSDCEVYVMERAKDDSKDHESEQKIMEIKEEDLEIYDNCEAIDNYSTEDIEMNHQEIEPDYKLKPNVQLRKKKLKRVGKSKQKRKNNIEEYEVIRLSREQVMQRREEASKNDRFSKAQYKCELCVKWFNYEDVLQLHMAKHNKTSPFECEICHQFFPSRISMQGHTKSHFVKYKCCGCGLVRVSRQHLLEHYAEQHQKLPKIYVCSTCGKTYMKRTMFQKHLRMHRITTNIPCDRCGKLFKTKESLRVHRLHHEELSGSYDRNMDLKTFSCDQCPKSFRYSSLLLSHKETHSDSKKYYCVECDIHFKSKWTMENHLRKTSKHIDPDSLKFTCDHCSKRFPSEKTLRRHINWLHLSQKNFRCDKCFMEFASEHGLRSHNRRIHEGIKPVLSFKCEVCTKAFSTKTLLGRHLRTHTGEKPFECYQCGRKFAQSSTMITHVRLVHLKVKRNIGKPSKDDQLGLPTPITNSMPEYFYQSTSAPTFDASHQPI